MSIRILDGDTINKIAAGEVIERPANALKELLENSADSGASQIEIDFDGGGKKEIKVTDDGCGIEESQMALALERHATSKISSILDLETLNTFGFRGEALSALSAVSELTLHSSPHDAEMGSKITVHGGKISQNGPAAALKGTQVVIKNLFYNIPARQKFLKSDAGETAALKKVVKSFALIHPELNLTLKQNSKVISHWKRESFKKRAQSILNVRDEQCIYLKTKDNEFTLEALLLLPQFSLNTQTGMSFFVQGRPVIDRTMQQAVLEGYRSLLMQHQYPQGIISLSVDPRSVDVNVHPAKALVKFLSPGTIFRFINSEIKKALAERLGSGSLDTPYGGPTSSFSQESFIEDAVTQYNQRALNPPTPQTSFAREYPYEKKEASPEGFPQISVQSPGIWSSVQVIGQYANTYIVGQSRQTLTLIDQHAAHERVLFERLQRAWKNDKIEKQASLFDETLTLSREIIEALTAPSMEIVIKKLGFEITDRGPTTLGVSSKPSFLIDTSLQPLFEKLGEQVLELNSTAPLEEALQEIWASMSCHGAIRAGRVLALEEMKALLAQMDEFSFSHFCPHGRPVSVNWDIYDLEKLFRRIV